MTPETSVETYFIKYECKVVGNELRSLLLLWDDKCDEIVSRRMYKPTSKSSFEAVFLTRMKQWWCED